MLLNLTPHESVAVVEHTPQRLVVDATYTPGGSRPPAHFHAAQDERFEILEGTLLAKVAGEERRLTAGDVLEIPRGVAHSMANAGDAPARARWTTAPAGRTLEWFRQLDRIQAEKPGSPSPVKMAGYLAAYPDVFRLAGPQWLLRPALAILARVGGRPATLSECPTT